MVYYISFILFIYFITKNHSIQRYYNSNTICYIVKGILTLKKYFILIQSLTKVLVYENLKKIISSEPWNSFIIEHVRHLQCRQLSGRALTLTLTCTRPGVQSQHDAPFSPNSNPSTRERPVNIQLKVRTTARIPLFCWGLLTTANSVLKFSDWWLRSPVLPTLIPGSYPQASLLPQPSQCWGYRMYHYGCLTKSSEVIVIPRYPSLLLLHLMGSYILVKEA